MRPAATGLRRVFCIGYRIALRAMPRPLRRRRSRDMADLFEELWEERSRRMGALAVSLLALRDTLKAMRLGLTARMRGENSFPSRGLRSGVVRGGWVQDASYGIRSLRQHPGFALVIVATLGIAIGVSSTIFSMVQMLIFVPIPFEDPATLTAITARNTELNQRSAALSVREFIELRDVVEGFSSLAAYRQRGAVLTTEGSPVRTPAMEVSSGFFQVTGLAIAIGRPFTRAEDASRAPVVLLSHGAWQTRFGGRGDILDQPITLDGVPHSVIGVVSPRAEFGSLRDVEFWRLLHIDSIETDSRALSVLARMKPSVPLDRTASEVAAIGLALAARQPGSNSSWELVTVPLRQSLVSRNAVRALALMGLCVVFVMFIACVNVANLMLARAGVRERELAVRMALGAPRRRIVRQLLVESLVLALLAGGLGLLVARATFTFLVELTRGRIGFFSELGLEPRVASFAFGIALVTPLVFGLLPALRATGHSLTASLGEGRGQSAGRRETRRRGALVTAQVALAVMLLVIAGLALRSVSALQSLPLGFDPAFTITAHLDTRLGSNAPSPAELRQIYDAVYREVEAGATNDTVALTSHRPIIGGEPTASFQIEGEPVAKDSDLPLASLVHVGPRYFDLTRIPLLRGRVFAATDGPQSLPVALVDRAASVRHWPDGDVLGARVRLSLPGANWVQIVGVVGNLRNPDADQPTEPHLYLPLAQSPVSEFALLLRAERNPEELRNELLRLLEAAVPGVPLEDVRTMEQLLWDDLASDFAIIGLVAWFAAIALGLATAGIYGVVAYAVSRRYREIGIRMALGAPAGTVVGMVVRQGLAPVAVGMIVGAAGGYALSRLMASVFYAVQPGDPWIFASVLLMLLMAATSACWLPARRAARVHPAESLRSD